MNGLADVDGFKLCIQVCAIFGAVIKLMFYEKSEYEILLRDSLLQHEYLCVLLVCFIYLLIRLFSIIPEILVNTVFLILPHIYFRTDEF